MRNLNRRDCLRAASAAVGGLSLSGWLPLMADQLATDPRRRRHGILLWMSGGPTQTDTFDMKPGHENGGEFQEIETNVPGVRFSEHLPRLATHADKLAIVRGLSTKEGDHSRGTHLMRTGKPPMGTTRYPAIGAALSKELGSDELSLPRYVSIAPYRAFSQEAYGPGFLGPRYSPLVVGANDSGAIDKPGDGQYANLVVDAVQHAPGISDGQMNRRLELWDRLQTNFVKTHPGAAPAAHHTVYRSAVNLMQSDAASAFDLEREADDVRQKYGNGLFGQGCLMARRLIEQGVSFVEVSLNGWDTHSNNFEAVQGLSEQLDNGWASLMEDLDERGLLESTTILWMGEFGRTPQINAQAGRDHFPSGWSCVFAGGGMAGGQAYGRTSPDGRMVEDGKMGVSDVLATLCAAVGVDPATKNISDTGRPLPIVDGSAVNALLA
ncbi:MAG: DUF1501 domain-containing protein [Planctomycetaceae bacterium]